MSAPQKATDEQVRSAITFWRGNVAAAASSLGISQHGLRKRMERLGIGSRALSFLRASTTHNQPSATMATKTPQAEPDGSNPNRKSSGRNFTAPADAPNLIRMPSAEAITEPVLGRRRKAGPLRLQPEQLDLLSDVKFDFMAKHRVDVTESDLLQRFFNDCFPDWSKRALDKKAKA